MRDPKTIKELTIYRGETEAGILKRTQDGCVFEYNPEFLKNSFYTGLSYRIPKSNLPVVVHGTNLHPFFAGLLPEGLRLKALLSNIKTSQDDLFSLFAASGSKCIGDVYAKNENESSPFLKIPKLREVDFYTYLQEILKENTYLQGEEVLSGVQEKISSSMISFPLNVAKSKLSYILKLNPKDKPNLVENEFHCMKLAKKCDINVAQVKLVKDKVNNRGLLVTRFDRFFDSETNKIKMVHQEDACQFLDKYSSDKYRISLNEIAKYFEELPASSLLTLQILKLYCFSYLMGNGDLHAKNISLHTLNGRVGLTAAYDLICTYIYGDKNMAIRLDGRDDNIKRKTILDFSKRFEVEKKAVENMLDTLISKFEKNQALLFKISMEDKKKGSLLKLIEKRIRDLQD